jgi:hypothetical protein
MMKTHPTYRRGEASSDLLDASPKWAFVIWRMLRPYHAIIVLTLTALACNLPVRALATQQAITMPALPPTTATLPPAMAAPPTESATIRTPTAAPLQTLAPPPTASPMPSDVEFAIDCSALPAGRKPDCEAFINATRDQVYPILREITGISLSQCYKVITYKILPTDPSPGAGGYSTGDTIVYNQRYSIDLPHRYDVHELLHSLSTCGHALDKHVFHGLVLNAVYDRLGVHDPGYFTANDENLVTLLDGLMKASANPSPDQANQCRAILADRMTQAYFELGPQAAVDLYRSTVPPARNTMSPNEILSMHWGAEAAQVETLLEMLKIKYNTRLNVPQCGY